MRAQLTAWCIWTTCIPRIVGVCSVWSLDVQKGKLYLQFFQISWFKVYLLAFGSLVSALPGFMEIIPIKLNLLDIMMTSKGWRGWWGSLVPQFSLQGRRERRWYQNRCRCEVIGMAQRNSGNSLTLTCLGNRCRIWGLSRGQMWCRVKASADMVIVIIWKDFCFNNNSPPLPPY